MREIIMLTTEQIKFFNSMFAECSLEDNSTFSVHELENLINNLVSCFDKKILTNKEIVNSINEIFHNEIKKHESFFGFNDTSENKAKRTILKAWQNEILSIIEGKKIESIALEDVNRVFYDAAQCLHFGIHPKTYRLICLSTIHDYLDNNQWMEHIDGLAYIDKNRKEKPTNDELYSFLKNNIAPIKTDDGLEEQLKCESLSFTLRYDRIKDFISRNNIFNGKKLTPLEKISFQSIFLSSEQKVNLLIQKAFPNQFEDWAELFPNISAKLKLKKASSHIFEEVYAGLFSETEDLHEIAKNVAKQIKDSTSNQVDISEVDTGLEVFFEKASQIISEVGDRIDRGNEVFEKLIDSAVEQFPSIVQPVASNVIDSIYKPEPFFVVNPGIIKLASLTMHSLDETHQHILTVKLAKQMIPLKAYFEKRINEISTLNRIEYEIFKTSFEKELTAFLGDEKERSKTEVLDNFNLHLSLALPFYLLEDSLTQNLSEDGKKRIADLSHLLKQSTAKVWKQWSSKNPTVSEIEYLLRQTQNFSTYLSSDFHQNLNDLEEYIKNSSAERVQNETEINDL